MVNQLKGAFEDYLTLSAWIVHGLKSSAQFKLSWIWIMTCVSIGDKSFHSFTKQISSIFRNIFYVCSTIILLQIWLFFLLDKRYSVRILIWLRFDDELKGTGAYMFINSIYMNKNVSLNVLWHTYKHKHQTGEYVKVINGILLVYLR